VLNANFKNYYEEIMLKRIYDETQGKIAKNIIKFDMFQVCEMVKAAWERISSESVKKSFEETFASAIETVKN